MVGKELTNCVCNPECTIILIRDVKTIANCSQSCGSVDVANNYLMNEVKWSLDERGKEHDRQDGERNDHGD